MLRTVGSGPDSQCGPEQVCSSWASVSTTCEMGTTVHTSQSCGQEGWRPRQWPRGRHQVIGCSLPWPARPHRLGALRAGAAVQASPSVPLPSPPTAAEARGPGSRVAPPRPGSPPLLPPRVPAPAPAGAPPAFRRGCGSRKRRARRSALPRPDAPRTTRRLSRTTRRAPAAAPGRSAPGPSLEHLRRTGRAARIAAPEAMGTQGRPAVAGQREPRF